jgi:uncharacterized protein YdhG (YjbR/CyaY superfamily)
LRLPFVNSNISYEQEQFATVERFLIVATAKLNFFSIRPRVVFIEIYQTYFVQICNRYQSCIILFLFASTFHSALQFKLVLLSCKDKYSFGNHANIFTNFGILQAFRAIVSHPFYFFIDQQVWQHQAF